MTASPDAFDHAAALAYLHGRIDYERNTKLPYRSRGLKLDRMRELAARLGNPHQRYPILHVAGTKGKGSTASMLAAILTAAGYRTGLYTSPHLDCVPHPLLVHFLISHYQSCCNPHLLSSNSILSYFLLVHL